MKQASKTVCVLAAIFALALIITFSYVKPSHTLNEEVDCRIAKKTESEISTELDKEITSDIATDLSTVAAAEENRLIDAFVRYNSKKTIEFMDVYPPIFAYYTTQQGERPSKFALLEIGNRRGETFRTYLEIFNDGDIYGLDLGVDEYAKHKTNKLSEQFPHAHMFVGDQADVSLLNKIGNEAVLRNRGFDIVNDDGGHTMNQQTVSLINLWKFVKPNGYYIIEDIETSYYKSYGGGELSKAGTFLALLKELVDVLQRDFHGGPHQPRRGHGKYSRFIGDHEIASIQFFANACVIRKSKESPWPTKVKDVENAEALPELHKKPTEARQAPSKSEEQRNLYESYHAKRGAVHCSACHNLKYVKDMFPCAKVVLDAGAGNCMFTRALLKEGFDVKGTEFASTPLKRHCNDLVDSETVVQASLTEIPFPDGHFNLVTSFEVLEHVPEEDVDRAVAELVRVSQGHIFTTISLRRADADPPYPATPHLHITVKSRAWWDEQFGRHGCVANRFLLDVLQSTWIEGGGPALSKKYANSKMRQEYLKTFGTSDGINIWSGDEIEPWYFIYTCKGKKFTLPVCHGACKTAVQTAVAEKRFLEETMPQKEDC